MSSFELILEREIEKLNKQISFIADIHLPALNDITVPIIIKDNNDNIIINNPQLM